MRKLHDALETRRVIVALRTDDGAKSFDNADQVYVSEDGRHVIVHSVLPNGRRMVNTFTNVVSMIITGV